MIFESTEIKNEKETFTVDQKQKKDCCGCTACKEICPVSAISMHKDNEGFIYPVIKNELCIKCGKCNCVCGFYNHTNNNNTTSFPTVYAAKHKDLEVRESSRSGAVFIGISDYILKQGGVIYGAVIQEDFSVKHIRASNKFERDLMKKAKYVQSDTSGIYPMIVDDLQSGKWVLFTGTPCQNSSLREYISCNKITDERLVCCDIVCHGVPSPIIWINYVKMIEKKYHKKVIEVQFRDKEFGWNSHFESFVLDNNRKIATREYTDLFYQHIMFRPSCGNCKFTNLHRIGDFTMGDLWGIEKQDNSFNDNKGASLLFVNTEKGKKIFEIIKEDFECFECNIKDYMQPTLQTPSVPSPKREKFWHDYENMRFDKLVRKYTVLIDKKTFVKKTAKHLLYSLGIRKKP